MGLIVTLLYFALALMLLITVHEFGHFIVARYCGVKVLRFSFGFGKVLASWRDKRGTEFALSLVPFGGYVKMLDEAEGEVPKNERPMAFNNKSIWARMSIILAGPLFNFIFAFIALWLVLVIGIQSLAPIIGEVKPGSIAARAGLISKQEILGVNGHKVVSWHDVQYAFMPLVGSDIPVSLRMTSPSGGKEKTVVFSLENWPLSTKNPDLLGSLGIQPFIPKIPPIVGEIVPDSPAQSSGLQVGDQLVAMNGKSVEDWLVLVDFVKKNPNQALELMILRQGKHQQLSVTIGQLVKNGSVEGFLGLRSQRVDWPSGWLRLQREAPLPAMATAFDQTIRLTGATFAFIGRLATGKLSLRSISGPVGIAQGAGASGRSGLAYYLSFLALVSISLGVLNLLPIPMLDGGQLLYCLIELIRRRPLSDQTKFLGMYLGMVMMVALMIIALTNDLSRLT